VGEVSELSEISVPRVISKTIQKVQDNFSVMISMDSVMHQRKQ
jgi:hypothetical protein